MAREESCVLTNMCMVYHESRILVQDRKDPDWGGITFPGGHVEPGESFVDAVKREVWEETGLTLGKVDLCGVKQVVRDDRPGRRYLVFFYKSDDFSGELHSSVEGEVFWIEKADLGKYPLADGFDKMFEVFEDDTLSEYYWKLENGKWTCENK